MAPSDGLMKGSVSLIVGSVNVCPSSNEDLDGDKITESCHPVKRRQPCFALRIYTHRRHGAELCQGGRVIEDFSEGEHLQANVKVTRAQDQVRA
jgi:hypothetical protein